MANPSKYPTPEDKRKLLQRHEEARRVGTTTVEFCRAYGISRRTLEEWSRTIRRAPPR